MIMFIIGRISLYFFLKFLFFVKKFKNSLIKIFIIINYYKMMESYISESKIDYLFKIIIIGESNSGKTTLTKSYINNMYVDNKISTIGVDFGIKLVDLDGKSIKLQLWDTAGQERFRAISHIYYKNSDAVILLYDISDKDTFNRLNYWLDEVSRFMPDAFDVPKLLIGAKCDLEEERKVSVLEGKKFAEDNNLMFLEVSSKTNFNVELAFKILVQSLLKKRRSNSLSDYSRIKENSYNQVLKEQIKEPNNESYINYGIVIRDLKNVSEKVSNKFSSFCN